MSELGTGESQPVSTPESTEAQKSLREKTFDFFDTKHALLKIGAVGITLGSIGNVIMTNNPEGAILNAGILLGIVGAIDIIHTRRDAKWEKRKQENRQDE